MLILIYLKNANANEHRPIFTETKDSTNKHKLLMQQQKTRVLSITKSFAFSYFKEKSDACF